MITIAMLIQEIYEALTRMMMQEIYEVPTRWLKAMHNADKIYSE